MRYPLIYIVIFLTIVLEVNTLVKAQLQEYSITEQMAYSTVKIDVKLTDVNKGTGTGFFFLFPHSDTTNIPVIVTNKHVVEKSKIGEFYLTLKNDDGFPIEGNYKSVIIEDFASNWIMHPNSEIDLAIMPIAPLLRAADKQNINFFYIPLDKSLLMTQQELNELNYVENILMIGYPNGIWDSTNNLPIAREGITATHPAKDYNGKPEFVIDAACFPGSSGSPVFLYNVPYYTDKKGNTNFSSRVKLLGVLWGGPQYTPIGEIKIVEIPMRQVPIIKISVPNNLGFVVKAEKLLDFEKILIELNK